MSRIENIKRIEMDIFGKTHNDAFDASFIFLNNYLEKNYFTDKGYKWNEEKAAEELNEVREACDQLWEEIDRNVITKESLHHVIEEIGDWILATSSVLKYPEYNQDKYDYEMKVVKSSILRLEESLVAIIRTPQITAESVFQSNKEKIEEYAAALNAYENCLDDTTVVFNPLARIIRMLYTKKDLRDPNKKDKIIKELRRMRFALVHAKQEGIL